MRQEDRLRSRGERSCFSNGEEIEVEKAEHEEQLTPPPRTAQQTGQPRLSESVPHPASTPYTLSVPTIPPFDIAALLIATVCPLRH